VLSGLSERSSLTTSNYQPILLKGFMKFMVFLQLSLLQP